MCCDIFITPNKNENKWTAREHGTKEERTHHLKKYFVKSLLEFCNVLEFFIRNILKSMNNSHVFKYFINLLLLLFLF